MDTVTFNAQAVNTYWIIARSEAKRANDERRVALLDGIHDTAAAALNGDTAAALNGDTVIITDIARRTALHDGHRYITHQARTALTR